MQEGQHQALPMVAIIGKPNVGKSTIFNRLVGARLAIVEDIPGVTRDRHYTEANIRGKMCMVVDTGGIDPESDDPMKEGILRQVKLALEECDVVLCVLDATADPSQADVHAVDMLRRSNKKTIYIANKADSKKQAQESLAYYELGLEELFPVSALHGTGFVEVETALFKAIPEVVHVPDEEYIPRISIIGRPNAGKSSILNRILKTERQLVDHRPGTTVDPVDAMFEDDEGRLLFIDTAGIRRKRAIEDESVEAIAVMKALRSLERCHAALVMVDGAEGISVQDARLIGLAIERGRALVVGLNKMDLLSQEEQKTAIEKAKETLRFAPWIPILPLSVKTGRAVTKVLTVLRKTLTDFNTRITTSELNRFFAEVLETHPPPVHKNRSVRLFYITQIEVRPPKFAIITNEPDAVHTSYQRYVTNAIRKHFGFEGVPLRISYRAKRKKELSPL